MTSLIGRIRQGVLYGIADARFRAALIELAIPIGGSGERPLQRIRGMILHNAGDEADLRDAFGDIGITGIGTGARPLPRIRSAILQNLFDSEATLREGLNDLLAPGELGGGSGAPTDIAWAGSHTVAENVALGTQVGGALSFVDPEDTATFSLTNSAGGLFGIDGTSVIVTGVIDYETATSHNITVRATDSSGLTYDEVFAVTVTDVAEGPPPVDPGDGEVIVDDPGGFVVPPTVVTVDDAIAFQGNKKKGASGKFIFDLGMAEAGKIYTMQYDPDWSLLENGGVTAMVGFGLRQSNDFRTSGLKGNGSTGLKAFEIFGADKWNKTSGFTTNDGGTAAHGTQGGPNWLQLEVAENGATYTLRTSADGEDWTDEFTDITPTPFADVDSVTSFGIAVFLDANDAGPFRVDITLWQVGAALEPTSFDAAQTTVGLGLSNGNLTALANNGSYYLIGTRSAALKTTGKYYFEMTFHKIRVGTLAGILRSTATYTQMAGGTDTTGVRSDGNIMTNNTGTGTGPGVGGFAANDVACFAIDLTARKVWIRRNGGSWNGIGADPATGASGYTISSSFDFSPAISMPEYPSLNDGWTANFGATAFAQAVPAGFTAGWG